MTQPTVTYRICVVCLGNICRSPMAAVVLRHRLDKAGLAHQVTVDSAGTGSWHVGQPADPRAVATLREHGYPDNDHQARQFSADWFDTYDLILAMDSHNLADLRELAPTQAAGHSVALLRSYDEVSFASGELDVPDPYYGGAGGFRHILDHIERAADGLVEALREELRDR